MQFKKSPPLNIISCDNCKATGVAGFGKCPQCGGMAMGIFRRGRWQYFGYPLTRYHLALQAGRRILNRIRLITALVLWLTCWIWVGVTAYKADLGIVFRDPIHWKNFILTLGNNTTILFWLGVISLLYF